jgi:sulfur-oxidizing protein SoxY
MTSSSSTRRRTLALAGASLGALTTKAAATPQSARQAMLTVLGGEPRPGRVRIDAPDIAENGNGVNVVVSVESPMTAADHVRSIHVFAEKNPAPGVLSANFTPANGKAEIQFRMRLSQSQRIVAAAILSDGTRWMATRDIVVTVGGC